MVSEKLAKGYRVIGEYHTGNWQTFAGHVYKDVPNIPENAALPPPLSEPEPRAKVAPQPELAKSSLASQYPVSRMVRDWATQTDIENEWF